MANYSQLLAMKAVQAKDVEITRLRRREAENILLAWGGVCPPDWAITGDPTHMAEIIRQRGDELQTENLRLKEQLARTEMLVEVADEFVKRCEAGEVRSVKTYTKFKDALAHLAGKVEG